MNAKSIKRFHVRMEDEKNEIPSAWNRQVDKLGEHALDDRESQFRDGTYKKGKKYRDQLGKRKIR